MRRSTIIALASVLGLLAVLVGAAFAYDRSRTDTIAEGVRVGGVEVGGLQPEEARAALEREILAPLREPLIVERGTRSWRLGAKEARIAADLDGSVERALDAGRDGSFLTRTARSLTGGETDVDLDPQVTYSRAAVTRLVDRVRRAVDRPARDASVTFAALSVAPVAARDGRKVKARELSRRLRAAIVSPTAERTLRVRTVRVKPKVTTEELAAKYPTIITVDRSNYRLVLFKNLRPVKRYSIAVGQAGLETPAGLYTIQNMQTNPSWHVPDSDWAGDLAGKVIPPGPENPIKARWMGIFNGAGIHGTTAVNSLGTSASHGCVRMAIPDVIELYERVAVGTPVYIA
jgi:lipoprotein-anchoring transpeptidase ErfK/SrfK